MFLFHLTLFQRLTLAFNTHQSCDLCDLCILSDMWRRLPRHHSFLFLCFSWVSGLLCFWYYFSKFCKNSCCSYTSSPSISNNIIDLYLCFRGNLSLNTLVLPRCKPSKEFSRKILGCPDVLFWTWNPSHPTSIHQKLDDVWYDNDSITPSDDMKWLNKLKVFWLRIPQIDDLTRLKVVGTHLANWKTKKKHDMSAKHQENDTPVKASHLLLVIAVCQVLVPEHCLLGEPPKHEKFGFSLTWQKLLSQNGSAILAVNVCTHNPCKCKHSKF